MPRDVLTDNYTLQGAYGYLSLGRTSWLYEACIAHLVELLVVYDRIYVPEDVLKINPASHEIAQLFPEVILGKTLPRTPDIHHDVVNHAVLDSLQPLIATQPFAKVDSTLLSG